MKGTSYSCKYGHVGKLGISRKIATMQFALAAGRRLSFWYLLVLASCLMGSCTGIFGRDLFFAWQLEHTAKGLIRQLSPPQSLPFRSHILTCYVCGHRGLSERTA